MGSKKSSENLKKDDRTRNWTFIVYPDSAPENWEQILINQAVPWFCSPLHDSDLNADDSEKKPHWHCALCFENKKNYEQILEIISPLNCTIPQKVKSMKSMLRYFIHADNPEKHQYEKSDIRCFGGAEYDSFFLPTRTDKMSFYGEIIDWIEENDIIEFCDLVTYARMNEPDWASMLYTNSTIFFNSYITSRRNKHIANDI